MRGLFEAGVRHQSNGLRLGALEFRIAPRKKWEEIRDQALALAELGRAMRSQTPPGRSAARASDNRTELGLIFHFLKSKDGGRPRRIHADPGQNGTGFRFGSWYKERDVEAQALAAALSATRHPELLLLIRGVDVASSERAIPTWATAPLLHRVRDESIAASTRLRASKLGWSFPPLQLTYHAGEEFSRLVEGLRRVQELRACGLLQSGDRIGHGVSLGLSPRRWAASARQVLQPLEDRLEDLLWEMERYGRGEVSGSLGRLERVRSEVMTLSSQMYGEPPPTLDELLRMRGRLHRRGELAQQGYPNEAPAQAAKTDLLMRYLTDADVFRRGQRPVEVIVDDAEVAFLEAAQRWMCADLSRLEITIEVNPSSNLLIADLLGMEDHPVFQLSEQWLVPPDTEGTAPTHTATQERSELLVSLSSDDPITFATRLGDEYAYLYFALLRRRVPSARALDWIHQLRERGMRSRFTVQESSELENLDALIESLRPSLSTSGA